MAGDVQAADEVLSTVAATIITEPNAQKTTSLRSNSGNSELITTRVPP